MGANQALLDACELGVALADAADQGKNISEVLRAYERIMIPRGREHVLLSRADAEADDHFNLSGGRVLD
jgi:2-polyprenyl-6-methoxyphenol hydroxylase-like FAD-dependent oxidoreductase